MGSEDHLEKAIRTQVGKVSEVVSGELEADEASVELYPIKVRESVEHLENLCQPLIDEEYEEEKEEKIDNLRKESEQGKILEKSKKKHSALVQLLHRKGVL